VDKEIVKELSKIVGEDYISTRKDILLTYSTSASTTYERRLPGAVVRPRTTDEVSDRVKSAEDIDAEIIATACPFCEHNLIVGAELIGSSIRIVDIVDLLAESLK